jgi:hypothetical protein
VLPKDRACSWCNQLEASVKGMHYNVLPHLMLLLSFFDLASSPDFDKKDRRSLHLRFAFIVSCFP